MARRADERPQGGGGHWAGGGRGPGEAGVTVQYIVLLQGWALVGRADGKVVVGPADTTGGCEVGLSVEEGGGWRRVEGGGAGRLSGAGSGAMLGRGGRQGGGVAGRGHRGHRAGGERAGGPGDAGAPAAVEDGTWTLVLLRSRWMRKGPLRRGGNHDYELCDRNKG